jgi:hypothetical protein
VKNDLSMGWLWPLIVLLVFAISMGIFGKPPIQPHPLLNPQSQKYIQTEQKTNGSVQHQHDADAIGDYSRPSPTPPPGTARADNSNGEGEYGGDKGTEFWPVIMGFRVKVTDSLLVLVTLALAWFTQRLWKSTDKL